MRAISMSPPSLAIGGPPPHTFPEAAIAEIRTSDPLLNGALVGAGVGAGLALWDYLIDPSEPSNGAIFAVAIGLGSAIGAGIDKLIDGRRVLYRADPRRASLTLAPMHARHRRGVCLSIRF